MISFESNSDDLCPFIDLDDPRCRSHFTLDKLSHAFGECVEDHTHCAHYYRLLAQHPRYFTLTRNGVALQRAAS